VTGLRTLGVRWAALFLCVMSSYAGCSPGALGAGLRQSARRQEPPGRIAQFPLWSTVPVKRFAVLGEGTVRSLRWGIYAFRERGAPADRPCIEEAELFFNGGFSSGATCGSLAPPADWPVFSLFQSSGSEGGKAKGASVIGLTFGQNVNRVTVDLGPGPNQTKKTRLLSNAQAKKAGLVTFRYLAFSIARSVCLEGVTGYDEMGEKSLDTSRYDCTGPEIELPMHRVERQKG
jgi:hypothetical protein